MEAFKKIQSSRDIQDIIANQKRIGIDHSSKPEKKREEKIDFSSYLSDYVFNQLGMTPLQLIGVLETQYYAEQDFRDRRQRNIDFSRGRQFNEPVWDSDLKRTVTLFEYLRRRGIPPLTYNVISKLVRSLVGQFREINTGNVVVCDSKDDRGTEIANFLTTCLDRVKKDNNFKSKDAAGFKEHLHSGRPVLKVLWSTSKNNVQPWIKFRNVLTPLFMINPGVVDYDMDNLHTMCEIHDTSLNDIITMFARGNYDKGLQIKRAYIDHQGDEEKQSSYSNMSFSGNALRDSMFQMQGVGNSAYRYYEIWKEISDYEAITFDPLDGVGTRKIHKWRNAEDVKKEIDEENARRKELAVGIDKKKKIYVEFSTDYVARYYVIYLTPWGDVLDVRESPYKNGRPPYVTTPPDINGEIWGIVEEVINAQKSLDRQIQLADAIVDNASKGVWLVPDTAVPDDMSNREYLSNLKKVDGAIIYQVRDGVENLKPTQEYANAANVSGNVQQLIQLYSNLVDEISGNYGAAQGKSDSATKTATGYALESQNAGLNVKDMMETYLTSLVDRDRLVLDFIIDGFTAEDYFRILGVELDPREVNQYRFSIEQSKGTNSPAHRLALEQELLQLVYQQLLPFEVFMDISNNPVMIQAKQKLQDWQKKQAETQQQVQQVPTRAGEAPDMAIAQDQVMSVQGHPQASALQEQPVGQQLPKLPGIGGTNIK